MALSSRARAVISVAISLAVFLVAGTIKNRNTVSRQYSYGGKDPSIVRYVVDGDTVEMGDGERVRLLGINAPETGQPYAQDAKDMLKREIDGKKVILEKDITNRDRYGRLLRYIWLGDTLVNLEMAALGYVNSYTVPPDIKYQDKILEAERNARNEKRGVWGISGFREIITVAQMHADAEGNDNTNLNGEYVVFKNEGTSPVNMERWSVKNEGTRIFTFPAFTLGPNASVTLRSGSGANTKDTLYWNRTEKKYPVWNNKGGTLYLRDEAGLLVFEYHY